MASSADLCLIVRRIVPASCSRLFEAWTQANQLQAWWGPKDIRCINATCDLRVGGRYRIDNELPNGSIIVISGEFLEIKAPHKLVYTWNTLVVDDQREIRELETGNRTSNPRDVTSRDESQSEFATELVTVRFVPHGTRSEVIVCHERINDSRVREEHEQGWSGCLEGLLRFCERLEG